MHVRRRVVFRRLVGEAKILGSLFCFPRLAAARRNDHIPTRSRTDPAIAWNYWLAYTTSVYTISAVSELVQPRGCTNFKLRQLNRVVTRHYDACVAVTGLRTTQLALLSHVVLLGPIRPSKLAKIMALDASTLTRNLQPLVSQGWLRQGPGQNARCRLVAATREGRTKRSEAQRAWQHAQRALHERLGIKRVAALHSLLDECMARLTDLKCGGQVKRLAVR